MSRRSTLPHPPPRDDAAARPGGLPERHSGEGAASALALMQALERRRDVARPVEPAATDGPDTPQPDT